MARTRFAATIAALVMMPASLVASGALAREARTPSPPPAISGPMASADDTAKFLAGMQPSAGSPLTPFTQESFWKQHAKTFDDAWTGLDKRQLSKVRTLVAKHFTNPQPVLLYTFSGPDFLYADAFFPSATTYIMAGLEPPGNVIDLRKYSRGEVAGALQELRTSLSSILSYSFFQTKFMSYELRAGKLVGTLPVLMTFLARSGKTIYDVSLFDLTSDGVIHPAEDKVANTTSKGVKIVFSDNTGKMRTIYYFSTDVSDTGIKKTGFIQFCDKLGTTDSFVKSASYLMHSDNFSIVRGLILQHSASLLEDDSGIPVRFLAQGWRLQPFGRYVGPIPLFAGQTQSKLYDVFGKGRATPVDFSLGYRWRSNESNILLAVKDSTATAFEVPPASPAKPQTPSTRTADEAARPHQEAKAEMPRPQRIYRRRAGKTEANPFSTLFGYAP